MNRFNVAVAFVATGIDSRTLSTNQDHCDNDQRNDASKNGQRDQLFIKKICKNLSTFAKYYYVIDDSKDDVIVVIVVVV